MTDAPRTHRAPQQPGGGIAPARMAAFGILKRMESADAHSDDLLHGRHLDALSPQDRNLATALVMGVLRWQIALDEQIARLLARPATQLAIEVRIALRLGAFQLIHLDRIPPHAAISESVELAKHAGAAHAAGMVNAVLRKISAAAGELRAQAAGPFTGLEVLAGALAHPAWLVERWSRLYGPAVAEKICLFDQQPPPLTIRLFAEDAETSLIADGIQLAPGEFLTRARRVVGGDLPAARAFREGSVRIQDEGSQLVAELAGAAEGSASILDMCAAPGGKTAILAERHPAAVITASDISRKRLEEMERLLPASIAGRVRMVTGDAATTQFDGKFDLILADVPCSGTGTLSRNPEIRHRLTLADLKRQHDRQVEILLAGMAALKPRGWLVYSTCSLEPEENEAVVGDCLKRRRDFRREPLEPRVEQLLAEGVLHAEGAERLLTRGLSGGNLRTIPGMDGCDGFFAAALTNR
jgi:16S rRNA (cytosine967-C5)-methyltransferase